VAEAGASIKSGAGGPMGTGRANVRSSPGLVRPSFEVAAMGFTIAIVVGSLVLSLVLIVVVMKMVRGSMGDPATLANGTPAAAVVTSLEMTGTVINDMYYVCRVGLQVALPGQAPYAVTIKQSVPVTHMARVNPGASIGVKVDPADASKVVIDWNLPIPAPAMPNVSAGAIASAMTGTAAPGGVGAVGVQVTSPIELLRHGQRVLGVLSEFADTGTTPRSIGVTPSSPAFIDDPLYAVTLQLHFENMAPVEAKLVQRVPRAMVPQLRIGWQLNCAVDPADPTRNVTVDWGDLQ